MSTARLIFDQTGDKIAERVVKMRSSPPCATCSPPRRTPTSSRFPAACPTSRCCRHTAIRKAARAACDDEPGPWRCSTAPPTAAWKRSGCSCDLMRDIGVRVKPENVVLTTRRAGGARPDRARRSSIPATSCIAEGPTYLGALAGVLRLPAGHPLPSPSTNEGMRMDLLEEELARIGKGNPRLKFALRHPELPEPRRRHHGRRSAVRRLIELSHEYGFLVVEDDPYGRIRATTAATVLPLKALADDVVYLGTVSKVFAPGLRVGWIAAPKQRAGAGSTWSSKAPTCAGAPSPRWWWSITSPTSPWQKHAAEVREPPIRERRDAMLAALDEYLPGRGLVDASRRRLLRVGDAAQTTWTPAPCFRWRSSAGVTYTPGDGFYPRRQDAGKNCMRISVLLRKPRKPHRGRPASGERHRIDRLELYRAFIDAGAIGVPPACQPAEPADAAASRPGADVLPNAGRADAAASRGAPIFARCRRLAYLKYAEPAPSTNLGHCGNPR